MTTRTSSRPLVAWALALPSILAAGCGGDAADPHTLEGAARVVVEAMKTGDASKVDATLPREEEIEKVFAAGLEQATPAQREKAQAKWAKDGGARAVIAQMKEKMHRRVESARKNAGEDFDWSAAEFDRVEEPAKTRALGPDATVADVAFFVKAGDVRYRFRAKEAMRLPSGWNFSEGWHYVGPDVPPDPRVAAWAAEVESMRAAVHAAEPRLQRIAQDLSPYTREAVPEYAAFRASLAEALASFPDDGRVRAIEADVSAALASRRLRAEDRERLQRVRSDLAFLDMGRAAALRAVAGLQSETHERVRPLVARLEADVVQALAATDASARAEAERLALLLSLRVAIPHFAAAYDAAREADARLLAVARLKAVGGSQEAETRLRAWIADASRPTAERALAFRQVLWLVPAGDRIPLAVRAGPEAVAGILEDLGRERSPFLLDLMPHVSEAQRASAWKSLMPVDVPGVPPAALWTLVAAEDVEVARHRAQVLALLDGASLSVRGAAPAALATELGAVLASVLKTSPPLVEAVGAASGTVTLEHRGPGLTAALLAALRGAGLEMRVTAKRVLIGAPADLAPEVERDAILPSSSPVAGEPAWKAEIRAWLRATGSVPFFSSDTPAAEFLAGVHYFDGTPIVVLPGLVAKASDAVRIDDVRRQNATVVRMLLERHDARGVLHDGALVLGLRPEVSALPPEAPEVSGLPPEWTREGRPAYHVTQPALAGALGLLPAEALGVLDVSPDLKARFARTPAPFVRLSGPRSNAWTYLRMLLLGTPFEPRFVAGRVSIVPRE